jgi:hypothetical protein
VKKTLARYKRRLSMILKLIKYPTLGVMLWKDFTGLGHNPVEGLWIR